MLVGNLCQQLYSVCDSIIISRDAAGIGAVAAIGATGAISWLLIGSVSAFAQGLSILFGQRMGSKDQAGLRRAYVTALWVALALSPLLTGGSILLARLLLHALQTPLDILPDAALYATMVLSGIPLILLGNLFAGILRALGNSRTPLIVQVASLLLNIILDLLFIRILGWGIRGAAAATLAGYATTCALCFLAVRRLSALQADDQGLKPEADSARSLLRLGIPLALMNLVTATGSIVQAGVANAFGSMFVAGLATGHRVCAMMEQTGNALGLAACTFVSQNTGAGLYARARTGVRLCVKIGLCVAAILGIVVFFFGNRIVSFLITGDSAVAVTTAANYLRVMSMVMWPVYLLFILGQSLQGAGNAISPMIAGGIELAVRLGAIFLLPSVVGVWGVYLAEAFARCASFLFILCVWIREKNRGSF